MARDHARTREHGDHLEPRRVDGGPQVEERHPVQALPVEAQRLVDLGRPEFADVPLEVLGIETSVPPREVERAQRVPAVGAEEGVVVVVDDAARSEQAGHPGERRGGVLDVLQHLERDDRIEAPRGQGRLRDVVFDELDRPDRRVGNESRSLPDLGQARLLAGDVGID